MNGQKVRSKIRKCWNFYYVLAMIGLLLTLLYIHAATVDVVYSDYMRLILSYIKDARDFSPYMGPDIFTRMPVSYVQRLVNVKLFGYSTTFDMVLGVFGLFLSSLVLAKYARRIKMDFYRYALLIAVVYSLNKWEMLTNGSGWVHFMAFALFFWHYACIEREYLQRGDAANDLKLIIIPVFTILLVAGPYSGTYALSVLLAYAYIGITRAMEKQAFSEELVLQIKRWTPRAMAVMLPLMMYVFSRIHSVEDHAGATDRGFMDVFAEDPMLFPKFFLKTLASMLVGKEMAQEWKMSAFVLHLLGALLMLCYIYAVYANLRYRIIQRTIFPMLLLVSGIMNHFIITLSRWIFLKDPLYAMSSRYALQFQVGVLGMLLTLALLGRNRRMKTIDAMFLRSKQKSPKESGGVRYDRNVRRMVSAAMVAVIALSQFGFYAAEWRIAKYRKAFFEERREVARSFEQRSDEEIKMYMQYRSVEKTRDALQILRSQKLNIFRE